ncbi:MAG: hypothetical protein KatS3mg035_0002 [Bacteroidia bacterium]|nr:MAG: hypothetical protein KatS3mg035_0002 [Bacteroidia bacterium]
MNILPFFYQHLQKPEQKKYLLAVSGGVDSMVLFHLFLKTPFYFEVCHVNFQLRNQESDDDQHFVEQKCKENHIVCHTLKAETLLFAQTHHLSKQEAARIIRYQAFQQLLEKQHLDFIVTAHHLNDQTENIMYTLIKSSYHQVFEIIPEKHKNILRPLLQYTKKQILDYAKQNSIVFREDSSNLKNDYPRNKIRNQVIPILKEINPNLEKFLQKKYKNQALKEQFLYSHFQEIYKKNFQIYHHTVQIFNDTQNYFLQKPNELILFFQFLIDSIFSLKILSDEQILNLWYYSQKGKILIDKDWVIFKEKTGISFIHQEIYHYSEELIIEKPGIYAWNIFEVQAQNSWNYPIKVRRWKPADRWNNQKISDFLTKNQYPAWQKKIAFVIEDKNGKIISLPPKLL